MAAIFQGKSVIPIAATLRVGLIQVLGCARRFQVPSRFLFGAVAMLAALIAATVVFLVFADLTSGRQPAIVTMAQAALVFLPGALLGGFIAGRHFLLAATGLWLTFWALTAGISLSAHPDASYAAAFLSEWPAMLGSALCVVAAVKIGEWLASKRGSPGQSGAT